MADYVREGGILPDLSGIDPSIDLQPEPTTIPKPIAKRRTEKEYIPSFQSGPYAILLTLYKSSDFQHMSKSEIIESGQLLCKSSFTIPPAGSRCTAWRGMDELVKRELVLCSGSRNHFRYSLSSTGRDLAARIAAVSPAGEVISTTAQLHNISSIGTFTLKDGDYEIALVLDNREVRTQKDRSFFQSELEKSGCKVLTRILVLGDICWVAQIKRACKAKYPPELYNVTVVMDYLIERKSGDDLPSSIKDGRFQEQKYRLKKCGVRNIIYLVEETPAYSSGIGAETIYSVMAQLQVSDGFRLKETFGPMDTVDYLLNMTKAISGMHAGKDINGISGTRTCEDSIDYLPTLDSFNANNSKRSQLTITDIWARQLMTIRGISAQKAAAITRMYPTMAGFVAALDEQDSINRPEYLKTRLGGGRGSLNQAVIERLLTTLCATTYPDDSLLFG